MIRAGEGKTIKRQVSTRYYGELVIRLAPEGVYLREKGRRTSYLLPYGVAYQRAAAIEGERQARERLAARRERAKARKAGR